MDKLFAIIAFLSVLLEVDMTEVSERPFPYPPMTTPNS